MVAHQRLHLNFQIVHDFRRCGRQAGNPHQNIGLQMFWQMGEYGSGAVGRQMGRHQGDGLRMLAD